MDNINKLFPDFLIVGAAKSGTSSLDQYLRQHPDVCMPKVLKELNFFHLHGHEKDRAILKREPLMPTNPLSYQGFFYNKKPNQISGECSPSYLYYYEDTIRNIKQLHPNWAALKIIIILREPIEKIWSHYKFVRMKNLDPRDLNFKDSIALEKEIMDDTSLLLDLLYVDNTSYFKQVKAYKEAFEQVMVIKYDDLRNQPQDLVRDIFKFLSIDQEVEIDTSKRQNVSKPVVYYSNGISKKIATDLPLNLHKVVPARVKIALRKEEKMDDETEKELARYFYPEIQNLASLTGVNFDNWTNKYKKILN